MSQNNKDLAAKVAQLFRCQGHERVPVNLNEAIDQGLEKLGIVQRSHLCADVIEPYIKNYLAHKFQPFFEDNKVRQLWTEVTGERVKSYGR